MTTATQPRVLTTPLSEFERTFKSHDGVELFYRSWLPQTPASRAVIVFHRGHEHSGRLRELVHMLDLPDTAMFAWDARGHGRSPGDRGYAENFGVVLKDIDCFVRHIQQTHSITEQQTIVIGHSVGAVAVAGWVHDYAPRIRAMVLATPALRVKLYIPLAIPALRARMLLGGKAYVKSYVKATMLTSDPQQASDYASDPLISRNIAVNILLDLHDLSTKLLSDAPAIRTPTLILSSGNDWVVKNSAHKQFFDRLGSTIKEHAIFDGFKHAIFHEANRAEPIAKVRQFILKSFEAPAQDNRDLLHADEAGFTRDEFQTLRRPLGALSPKRINFAIQTLTLKTIARLSHGVDLGWKTGFDSGESLDHVYTNRAKGKLLLGKLIDRIYLNAIGWRGIRIRKQNIQTLLTRAMNELNSQNKPLHLLDIACGGGRYTLELLDQHKNCNITALLRDRSEGALNVARQTASKMNLTQVSFALGDAFDRMSIASIESKPTIAMVSGLYELFPDNARLRESLGGLHYALQESGMLIYTCQPWHPQLEMIARVLTNRDHEPWIMRRRTQLEMDELVRAAGFQKVETLTDPWGIFTVSIARKNAK